MEIKVLNKMLGADNKVKQDKIKKLEAHISQKNKDIQQMEERIREKNNEFS